MLEGGGDWANSDDLSGRCYNGTWCPVGMDRRPTMANNACPKGFYCPVATAFPVPCPAGKFRQFDGGSSESDCADTPEGFYTVEGAANLTGLCHPGLRQRRFSLCLISALFQSRVLVKCLSLTSVAYAHVVSCAAFSALIRLISPATLLDTIACYANVLGRS